MEYRILPNTDLRVSRLSFGTMPFGSQADQATSTRMVDQCFDAGINFFDTANMYNKGVAESFLGTALAGRRQRAIVASKVRHRWNDNPQDVGLSQPAILKALDATLQRLQKGRYSSSMPRANRLYRGCETEGGLKPLFWLSQRISQTCHAA